MFQMREVGGKIAARRKERNMTQMELADRMGVSFQAVSNWERGNSMPDIGKLPDLSEALGISIDDLLFDETPKRLIRHMLDGDEREFIKEEAVQTDTVAKVAPILRPQQAEALLDTVRESMEDSVDISDLVAIAPFVSSDYLHEWALKLTAVDSLSDIVPLAPFLPEASLGAIAKKLVKGGADICGLVSLAPFMGREALDSLLKTALSRDG